MVEARGEVTNELLFETLKSIQGTLARHSDEFHEIKERLGNVETQIGALSSQYASLSNRLDRMDGRIDRIERRLALLDA